MRPLKKLVLALAVSGTLAVGASVPAFASTGPGSGNPGNGTFHGQSCDAGHGAFADQNGNFGALGQIGGNEGAADLAGVHPGSNNSAASEACNG